MKVQKSDIAQYIAVVKVHYSHNYKNFSEEDFKLLTESWYQDLKEFDKDLVYKAFSQAKLVNRIGITTADIVEQIEKWKKAIEPTAREQWQALEEILKYVRTLLNYEFLEVYKQAVKESYKELYDRLDSKMQKFTGGVNGLIAISKKPPNELSFEKARFFKEFDSLAEREKSIKAIGNTSKLLEG